MLNTLYFLEKVEQIMLTNLRYSSFYVKLKKKIIKLRNSNLLMQSSRTIKRTENPQQAYSGFTYNLVLKCPLSLKL